MAEYITILILTTFLYFIPLVILLPFKLKLWQNFILFLIIIFTIHFSAPVLKNLGVILLLLNIMLYINILNHCFIRNTSICIISYCTIVIIDNVESTLFLFITGLTLSEIHESFIISVLFSGITLLSTILICKLLVFLHNKFRSHMEIPLLPKKNIFFIALNLLLILCLFIVNIVAGEQIGYAPAVITFNTIIFLLFFIVCVWTITQVIKTYKAAYEMNQKQENFVALQKYTKQVEDLYNSLRSFKHDYNNILISMTDYINQRDIDGLSAYFHEHILPETAKLIPDNYQLGRLSNIKKPELKGFITAKLVYAQEMNIETSIEAEAPIENIAVNIVDLTRVLGIFLDNAIEAALETPKPQMTFAAIRSDSETVFIVSNTFIDHQLNINQLSRPDISSKGSGRGIGLYNASKIIGSYKNMFLETSISNGLFIQTLHISE